LTLIETLLMASSTVAIASLAVTLLLGAVVGLAIGAITASLVTAFIIWLILLMPPLALSRKRDSKLSLKGLFLMFGAARANLARSLLHVITQREDACHRGLRGDEWKATGATSRCLA
jgi:hypothetical protein